MLRVEELGPREPGVIEWGPDLIEAQLLCGRVEEARQSLRIFEEQARNTENAWANASAARVRGMLVDTGFEQEFDAALAATLPRSSAPARSFGSAHASAGNGGRRMRVHRFAPRTRPSSCSARAAGPRRRARSSAPPASVRNEPTSPSMLLRDLTEQELRIALLVAEGATNREAAATLYLSPKTVGYHLARCTRSSECARGRSWRT